jgi:hypothetical protein
LKLKHHEPLSNIAALQHGLSVDEKGAAELAAWAARCVNAVTAAHGDLLSGRGNKNVLRAVVALYAMASLGAVLDSTWAVACVLWVAAFTVPPAWEARRVAVGAAARWASAEVGGRQGLTLVHISAQSEPVLVIGTTASTSQPI